MLVRWDVTGETGALVYSRGGSHCGPKAFFWFDSVFIWVLILEFFSDRDVLQSNESKVKLFLLKEDWLLRWERPVTTANNTDFVLFVRKKSLQHPDFLISSIICLFFLLLEPCTCHLLLKSALLILQFLSILKSFSFSPQTHTASLSHNTQQN